MKVSVVTPSYNQGRFIARTLASVAMQSGAEIEHVVVDGGSNDETIRVLKGYEEAVRWTSAPDRGQADAVNKAIAATNGDVIGWLNSDDIYYPDAIAQVAQFFATHPDVDVVYGMADHIDENDRAFEPYRTGAWDYERLKSVCFICQPAAFVRRRVIETYGPLDDTLHYCMDYEFWLRLGQQGARFGYLAQRLAGSRLYASNKTLGDRVAVHAEINDMLKAKFGRVPQRWLCNYAHALTGEISDHRRHSAGYQLRLLSNFVAAAKRWNGDGATKAIATCLGHRLSRGDRR